MIDKPKSDYLVGYGKPPVPQRFPKGRSGNLKGRPRGARSLKQLLADELASPITIIEGGRRKLITKREALAKRLVQRGLTDKDRALKLLLDEMDRLGVAGHFDHEEEQRVPIREVQKVVAAVDVYRAAQALSDKEPLKKR